MASSQSIAAVRRLQLTLIADLFRQPNTPSRLRPSRALFYREMCQKNRTVSGLLRPISRQSLGLAADPRAIREVRDELARYEDALAEPPRDFASSDRRVELEKGIANLRNYLGDAVNDKGRPRIVKGISQGVRPTVTKAIREAIDKVAERHPELGDHLRRCIDTGAEMMYKVNPAAIPNWSF